MIVVGAVATTLFLGGWLRPFPNVHWMNWLDALPALSTAAVGAYCVWRAGKQPSRVQIGFMWGVALACFAAALILAAPLYGPLSFLKPGLHGAFWFLLKISAYIYLFMWLRFTLPRYRFDQLMHLGWYILIPLAIVNVLAVGVAMILEMEYGWNRWLAMLLTTVITLAAALFLMRLNDKREAAASSAAPPSEEASTEDSYAG
jgi:NADH-quinone oxidoreductase subunit H